MKKQDLLPPALLSILALNPQKVELSHSFWLAASRKDSLTFTVIFPFIIPFYHSIYNTK